MALVDEMGSIATAACLAQVLSSATRIKLLKLVQHEELCVCELALILGISQPGVSQHLAKLRQADLVVERREGTMSFYRAVDLAARVDSQLVAVLAALPADLPELAASLARLPEAHMRRCQASQ